MYVWNYMSLIWWFIFKCKVFFPIHFRCKKYESTVFGQHANCIYNVESSNINTLNSWNFYSVILFSHSDWITRPSTHCPNVRTTILDFFVLFCSKQFSVRAKFLSRCLWYPQCCWVQTPRFAFCTEGSPEIHRSKHR